MDIEFFQVQRAHALPTELIPMSDTCQFKTFSDSIITTSTLKEYVRITTWVF